MNIKIPANKKRVPTVFFIGLIACFIFWFAIKGGNGDIPWYYYLPAYVALFTYAFFFTALSLFDYLKTLLDKNAMLIISDTELYDNLSIFSCGKISWKDISTIEILKIYGADFLIVKLLDNEKYLGDKNFIQRLILKKYIKKWGSPVVISGRRIDYDLNKLKEIILEHK